MKFSPATAAAARLGSLSDIVLAWLERGHRLSTAARYLIATLTVLSAAGAREVLRQPLLPYPFLLFLPPLLLVGLACGPGAAAYSTALAAICALRFIAERNGGHLPRDTSTLLGLSLFLSTGLLAALVIGRLRRTAARIADSEHRLAVELDRRARADAALAASEMRFRATFDHAAAGMAIVTLDGKWVEVNERLCRKLGYSAAELTRLRWQDVTYPEDIGPDLELSQRLLAGEIPIYSLEKRYLRKDGEIIWVLLTVALLRAPDGTPRHFISVVQDISKLKEAEEVLARDKADLQVLVEQRTAALMREAEDRRRAQDALRQGEKLQAIGRLTGGIAHDFNNFLQVVGGGAQLLQNPRMTETKRQAILEGMIKATANAADLTGRLLAFARRQTLRPEAFDLNARLREEEGMLRQVLAGRMALSLDLSENLPPVQADPAQLDVALMNLTVNARDAAPRAGGCLVIATRPGEDADGAPAVSLSVRDNGAGMPEEVIARAFEPFFTTKGPERGTGLGLAQVHGFAKQSGGDVRIESRPGVGTTITLVLPSAHSLPAAPAPQRLIRPDTAGGRGRIVLVVDDNADVGSFAGVMLTELGYVTRHASTADGALAVLAEDPSIDAVFSDIVMPGGKSGLDLALSLRERRPDLPVVLASGYSDALAAWTSPLHWEILRKPYRLEDLGAALSRAFHEAELVGTERPRPALQIHPG